MKNPNWWVALLKGILLIVFGVWLIQSPNENLEKLSLVFGLLILIGGLIEVGFSIKNRNKFNNWGWALTSGIFDLLLGAFLVANPKAILLLITFIISAWLVFRGVLYVRYALIQKKENYKRWRWGLGFGISLILLGALILWQPGILGFSIALWAALGFIAFGILRIIIVFKGLVNEKPSNLK